MKDRCGRCKTQIVKSDVHENPTWSSILVQFNHFRGLPSILTPVAAT